MGWEGNSIFQVVIIPGSGGGLFVYNGAPAAGNLIFSVVAPGVTSDPFGNAVSAVLNAGNLPSTMTRIDASGDLQILSGGSVVIVLNVTKKALFYYSPNLGAGNLVYSIAAVSGTDAAGNAFLPGAVAYKKITSTDFQALQVTSGGWNAWTAASNAGPWSLSFSTGLQPDEVGYSMASNVSGGSITIGEAAAALEVFAGAGLGLNVIGGGLQYSGNAAGDRLTATAATAPVIEAIGTGGGASPNLRSTVANLTALMFGCLVSGDTNARHILDLLGGQPRWRVGTGSGPPDTQIYRAGVGAWAADFIAWDNAGTPEVWNAVTFVNSWTNAAGLPNLAYRLVPSPDNCVQLTGRIVAPVGVTLPSNITAALPAAYRPAHVAPFLFWNVTQDAFVRGQLGTGGVISIQAGGGIVTGGDTFEIMSAPLLQLTQ